MTETKIVFKENTKPVVYTFHIYCLPSEVKGISSIIGVQAIYVGNASTEKNINYGISNKRERERYIQQHLIVYRHFAETQYC